MVRGLLPKIAGELDELDQARVLADFFQNDFAGSIARAIIYEDQLEIGDAAHPCRGQGTVDELSDQLFLVINGSDDT